MNDFVPIERFPYRICLDIVDHFKDYIKDKVVCDLGCGAGDLLEYIKQRNLCKTVKGIEKNKSRFISDRKYIQLGDIFEKGVPKADVYILWLGKKFPYRNLFDLITEKVIVIYMDGDEQNHNRFQDIKGMRILNSINYEYDETKFGLDSISPALRKINPSWTIKGSRLFKIYEFTPE